MKKLIIFILPVVIIACAQINQREQDHYKLKNKMRHGLVPIPYSEVSKKELKKPTIDKTAAKRGAVVYKKNCFSCHGSQARGDGPKSGEQIMAPRDLIKIAKTVPNFKFYMMASVWQNEMPGWKNMLSDKEIDDLRQYILDLAYNK